MDKDNDAIRRLADGRGARVYTHEDLGGRTYYLNSAHSHTFVCPRQIARLKRSEFAGQHIYT